MFSPQCKATKINPCESRLNFGRVAQLARATALQAVGHRFKSCSAYADLSCILVVSIPIDRDETSGPELKATLVGPVV